MNQSQKRYKHFIEKNQKEVSSLYDYLSIELFLNTKLDGLYESYLQILLKTAELMRELGLNDPIKVSRMYEYLLYNGYLSINHNFVFSKCDFELPITLDGASIPTGHGVCLNIASLHKDLLNLLGHKAYLVFSFCSSKMFSKKAYIPDINITDEFKKDKMERLNSFFHFSNHAATIFEKDGIYYISDPTNLSFMNFTSFLRARYIDGLKDSKIFPKFSKVFNYLSNSEYVDLFKKTYESIGVNPLTGEMIQQFSEEVMDLANSSKSLLDDFYIDAKDDIDGISKKLENKKIRKKIS